MLIFLCFLRVQLWKWRCLIEQKVRGKNEDKIGLFKRQSVASEKRIFWLKSNSSLNQGILLALFKRE